jgi:hypothetical protein
MPQTKYELMVELRELNRGYPPIAISSLRKHELEARIDALKKFRAQEGESAKLFFPVRKGPLGGRKIEVKEEVRHDDDEEETVKMPSIPAPRISEYSLKKARKAAKADPFLQMPADKPKARAPKVQNTITYDADPLPRGKSEAATYTPRAPGCPKCGATHYHTH